MTTKSDRIYLRVTEAEKNAMQAAADAVGLTLAAWLRMVALAAAKRASP